MKVGELMFSLIIGKGYRLFYNLEYLHAVGHLLVLKINYSFYVKIKYHNDLSKVSFIFKLLILYCQFNKKKYISNIILIFNLQNKHFSYKNVMYFLHIIIGMGYFRYKTIEMHKSIYQIYESIF